MKKGDFNNRTVLVRIDLNVPLNNGVIQDLSRIYNAAHTIRFLQEANAKIVLISHLGKTAEPNPEQSLKQMIGEVSAAYERDIIFIDDCLRSDAKSIIDAASPGEVFLLENLRFHKEEEKCDQNFAKQLASLADFYINEAFSTSHRRHASIYGIPRFLPHALGISFSSEIKIIDNFFMKSDSPKLSIVGGSKLSTKIKLLKNLVKKVSTLMLGGGIAGAFMAFLGHKALTVFNPQEFESDVVEIFKNAQQSNCELVFPIDCSALIRRGETFEHTIVSSDDGHASVFDIGPESVELFKSHIRNSSTVLWNGPLGLFEQAPFDFGTKSIAEEIAKLSREGKIQSIVGGGDTAYAIKKFGVANEITHLSTSGGAFLSYLEGTELPGLSAMTDPFTICA
jgi:phosphoglycerate kinase